MSAASTATGNVVRYRRTARTPAGANRRSAFTWRNGGARVALRTLAPVIPIFPALALAAEHRATAEWQEFEPVPA
jgi:hypothetical protein